MNEERWEADVLSVDPDSYVPLYRQLREQLRAAVTGLEPGTCIPSEKALMELTQVGRATIRRAIEGLVQEGLLETHQGRGTFVSRPRVESDLGRPVGFTATMQKLGRTPSTEVLEVEIQRASDEKAQRLEVSRGAEIVVLERLRYIDGEPAMVERCHLVGALVAGIDQYDLTGSLYELLDEEYGLRPVSGTETVRATNADGRFARLLSVPVATALLATARTTRTQTGIPLEFTLRHARGDLCAFRVELSESSGLAHAGNPPDYLHTEPARTDDL